MHVFGDDYDFDNIAAVAKLSLLIEELRQFEYKYEALVWYSRSDKQDTRLHKLRLRIEREFPEETGKLNHPKYCEQWRSFHRGCLETTRYVLRCLPDSPQQSIESLKIACRAWWMPGGPEET